MLGISYQRFDSRGQNFNYKWQLSEVKWELCSCNPLPPDLAANTDSIEWAVGVMPNTDSIEWAVGAMPNGRGEVRCQMGRGRLSFTSINRNQKTSEPFKDCKFKFLPRSKCLLVYIYTSYTKLGLHIYTGHMWWSGHQFNNRMPLDNNIII